MLPCCLRGLAPHLSDDGFVLLNPLPLFFTAHDVRPGQRQWLPIPAEDGLALANVSRGQSKGPSQVHGVVLDVAQDSSSTEFLPSSSQFPEPKEKGELSNTFPYLSIRRKVTSEQGQRLDSALSSKATQLPRRSPWNLTPHPLTQTGICSDMEGKDHLLSKSHIAGPGLLCLACCPASVTQPQHYFLKHQESAASLPIHFSKSSLFPQTSEYVHTQCVHA